MRLIVLLAFLSLCHFSFATNYYVAANGNDNNSGTSPSSAWKTINKVNSFTFKPGDQILFNRGDEFYGGIVVNQSGTAGAPITYGAYGIGAKPVITGFTKITSWTNLGGNIWESTGAVSTLPYTNMVTVNGVNTAMGRYPNSTGPNTGYLTIKSHSGSTSITSDQLSGSPNWKGADIVVRKEHFHFERGKISDHSGNRLTFRLDGSGSAPKDGFGFFVQNDPKTLDAEDEWYFNPDNKKLRIFSTSKPQNVEIATIENLFYFQKKNNITVKDIAFNGSNGVGIYCIGYTSNLNIQNCDISFAGGYGIFTAINYATIEGNKVSYANEGGIKATERYAVIKNNEIKNVYLFEGMSNNNFPNGIHTTNELAKVEYNKLDSCGYIGIKFAGANSLIKNNFVNYSCLIRDDGAGIAIGSRERAVGSIIDGNIVLNTIGAPNGTSDNSPDATGIMVDAWGKGITIINNTVANSTNIGIKMHGTNEIVIRNNTTYNNGGKYWSKGGLELLSRSDYPIRRLTIENNIFFAKTAEQYAMFGSPDPGNLDELKLFGTADNNYYAKPIDNNTAIRIHVTNMDAKGWSSYSGQDKNSKGAPKSISNVKDLRFEYNAGSSAKTISLDANYIDVKGQTYNGSITLAPYTSAVLIRNGARINQPPVADAGPDQSLVLPTNAITLTGRGTDPDGTIASYNWSKLSGPSSGTINSPSSPKTTITDLVQGTYQFVLKVTDNEGLSGKDTVQVTVNAAKSSSVPVANAGQNQQIVLPMSQASLNGSGTVEGAKITAYDWTKISGPSQGKIENSGAASTTVTGLVEGSYVFQLKVTADNGNTGTSEVTITVSNDGLLAALNLTDLKAGLDYKYYEATSYSTVPDFSRLKPIKEGVVNNYDLSIADRKERFAISFEGYIDVPSDGQYTFYTSSDDGSLLYIDGRLVVNNDGLHSKIEKLGTIGLKAGKHSISVGYFQQDWDGILEVRYAGPGISKRLIPSSSLYRGNPVDLLPAVKTGDYVPGINFSYYEATSYSAVPDFTKLTPIKSGVVNDFNLSQANRKERFAMDFTGYIDILADGIYNFYTESDDGSLLYIDGKLVVNNDGLHSKMEKSGTIGLKAGKHSISVGYFQQDWDGVLRVSYAGPGISKRLVPSSVLFRDNPVELLPAIDGRDYVPGINYSYYEALSYSVVPDFTRITPVKTGILDKIDLTAAQRKERFAMQFEGYLDVPLDGIYTFYTTSDDGSLLYIDNKLVVDNDGLHGIVEKSGSIGLKAGKHSISVGYFQQDWDGVLRVRYEGPGIVKQDIPSTSLFRSSANELLPTINPGSVTQGLSYDYFEASSYREVPNFAMLKPVKSGYTNGFDLSIANRKERFAVNFEGFIQIPVDGQYTFFTTSDDGSMLYIDGRLVVDNDGLHGIIEKTGTIGLKAGWHKISVGYFQQDWDGILQVRYSGPGISKQYIPSTILFRSFDVNSRFGGGGMMSVGSTGGSPTGDQILEKKQSELSFSTELNAYPNPFINSLNVQIAGSAGNYNVELVDGSGRVLKKMQGNKSAGTTTLTIHTSGLPKGFYFLRLVLGDDAKVIKLQK